MRIMSGSSKSLVFRFVADTARASRAIDNFILKVRKAQGLGGAGTSKDPALRAGFRGFFGRTEFGILDRLANKFGFVGEAGEAAFTSIAASAGLATAALFAFGFAMSKVFRYGTLVEGALMSMELLTGSAKKAHWEMAQAMRYSLVTPYKPAEVLSATATSLQYGIDPFKKGAYGLKKDRNAMEIFGGLGSFPDLNGHMLGVNRMATAVLRGDYRLLRPVRGIVDPAYQKAKATGFKVGTQGFNTKFIEELGKIPAIMNAAKMKSEGLEGLWSTIAGFAQEFWVAFGGAGEEKGVLTFWSQMKDIMRDVRDIGVAFIDYIRPGIVEWGATLGSGFKFIWDMLKEVGRMLEPVIVPMLKIWWQIQRAINSTIVFTLQTVVRLVRFVVDLISVWGKFFDKIFGGTSILSNVVSAFTEFVTGLQIMFQFASIFIDWVLNKIIQGVDAIVNSLTFGLSKAGKSLDKFYTDNKEVIDKIADTTGVTKLSNKNLAALAGSQEGRPDEDAPWTSLAGINAKGNKAVNNFINNYITGPVTFKEKDLMKLNQSGKDKEQ